MARWDHGYVTDVAYTPGVYLETTPAWIDACAVLLGFRPRPAEAPFRHADLGCGLGITALCVAAASPDSEVWGFDFNPTHIEFARDIARDAGLANAHFEEISFQDLARRREPPSAGFDYIVAHGVIGWVSPENRRHLIDIVARRLLPGGIAYLSYNAATGWAGMEPVRHLMRQLVQASPHPAEQAIHEMFQVLDALKAGGAGMFRDYPIVASRLDRMKGEKIGYFAHEFLTRDWHPLMFADVQEAMAETRTTFIGSATLTENLDAVALQATLLPVFDTVLDPTIRETIRDVASSKPFRRDLWRRGGQRMAAPEQAALLDAIALMWTGNEPGEDITFPSLIGTATGRREFYRPLLDAIAHGPVTIGDLRARRQFQDRRAGEFIEAAILLLGGDYARPALRGGGPGARDAAARLNRAIVDRIRMGIDIPWLAAPGIGAAVEIGTIEGLAIGGVLDGGGASAEALIEAAMTGLARSGRTVRRDGLPVEDPVAAREIVAEAIQGLIEKRLPLLRLTGALP